MRTSFLALVIAVLSASTVLAEQPSLHKPDKRAPSDKVLPLKGASSGNPCATFGPGFVKVEGSDTCVRIGGATSIGAGR